MRYQWHLPSLEPFASPHRSNLRREDSSAACKLQKQESNHQRFKLRNFFLLWESERKVTGGAGVAEVRAVVGAGFEEVSIGAEEEIDALVEEGAGGDAVDGDVEWPEGLGG